MRSRFRTAALVLGIGLGAGGAARAQEAGTVTGQVSDEARQPLPFANVVLRDTPLGTMTDDDGRFTLRNLAPGRYLLRVSFLGYSSQEREFRLSPGEELHFDFLLKTTTVGILPVVKVIDSRNPLRLKSTTQTYTMTKEDIGKYLAEDVNDAVAKKPGVVVVGGVRHIRGARGDETPTLVDGMPVNDPLGGGAVDLATISVEEVDLQVGGLDAEVGNAQAGVINITTREGGDHVAGEATYMTDDFGAPDRTFDNFDRLSLGFGGPIPAADATYYVSLDGTWSDTYLKTGERRERRQLLDFIRIGPRQQNDLNSQAKLAWTPMPTGKLTLEYLGNRQEYDVYQHTFSLAGFVETRTDTVADTGEIVTRYGGFSRTQPGPNWVYYNAPEHTPDIERRFDLLKGVWTHHLGEDTFYTLKMSRSEESFRSSVGGKFPWEYSGSYPDQWRDSIHFRARPFYATNGDVPTYTDRRTRVWVVKGDWSSRQGDHRWKSGFEARYNDLANLQVDFPDRLGPDGGIGGIRSEYHVYNPEGSAYLQDRWEYEGLVVNGGMRYDLFSVGDQLDASEVERRVRGEWSPRIGIAYPISDLDAFSFHYGRFSQVPGRQAIFENRGGTVRTRGNPNLSTQTTVSYQAALQHRFGTTVFGQFSVYMNDIYGLLTAEQVRAGDSPALVSQYVNKDYASARGFEVSLTRRFSRSFSGELAYTYGAATGVASDPNVQEQVDFLYLPISEQPLDWDQRHTVSATATVADPDHWSVTMVWAFGTGLPYTPRELNQRREDPLLVNSRRLPSSSNLTLQAEKHVKMWGQAVKLFVRGNNILDARGIIDLEPGKFPIPPQFDPFAYRTYYTETGRAGGAYLGADANEDGIQDWVPLGDPRVYGEGRTVRMGATVSF